MGCARGHHLRWGKAEQSATDIDEFAAVSGLAATTTCAAPNNSSGLNKLTRGGGQVLRLFQSQFDVGQDGHTEGLWTGRKRAETDFEPVHPELDESAGSGGHARGLVVQPLTVEATSLEENTTLQCVYGN